MTCIQELQNKGWLAAHDKPYIALGEFQNVISAVETLKDTIPHAKEMTAETQKIIAKVKRQQNPLFKSGANKQINIAAKHIDLKGIGEVDSTSIMKKMKSIEEQFYNTFSNLNESGHHTKHVNQKLNPFKRQINDDVSSSYDLKLGSNQRLITPTLKKLMKSKDASMLLKEEIQESQLRLKAVKYGHKLEDVVPQHNHSFYLPDKTLYFDRQPSYIKQVNSLNKKSISKSIPNPNRSFHSSVNANSTIYNNSAFITEPSMMIQEKSQNGQQDPQRKSHHSISEYIRKRTGIKQDSKYQTARDITNRTETNNRSFFSQKPYNTSFNEIKNQNQVQPTFYKKAFKTFDVGIQKLSPRKPRKLNEISLKYRQGMMKANESNNDDYQTRNMLLNMKSSNINLTRSSYSRHQDENSNSSIRFVSMIDSKPIQPSYLDLVPLKNFNIKDQELNRIMNKEGQYNSQVGGRGGLSHDEYGNQSKDINWGRMLHEDLEDLLKNKVDKQYEELFLKKKSEIAKRKSLLEVGKTSEQNSLAQTASQAIKNNLAENFTQQLTQASKNQLSSIQTMLLSKLISFESIDTQNADELMKKLYNFFFNWSRDQGLTSEDVTHKNKLSDYDDYESRYGRSDYPDDMEEKRKRLQLKLDQELIEFEEKGGFAQVLKNIFNPSDVNSMELDSVYQLKLLCEAFYEKKEKLSNNLIQTLDALSNERPKTMNLKKHHLNIEANKRNVHDNIEWMRINAERQRISQYREVAKESATLYYKVLKRFTEENQIYEKEKAQDKNNLQDPQVKMKALAKENTLKDILDYITGNNIYMLKILDFMKAVIENGNKFTKDDLFMMLKELNPDHLDEQVAKYLRILMEELNINRFDFDDFLREIKIHSKLYEAFDSVKDYLINDYLDN